MPPEDQGVPPPGSPELAVVIGAQNAARSVEACLEAVRRELSSYQASVLLADASQDGTAERVAELFPEVELLRCPPDLLVPELWGRALERTRAPWVAILNAECVPAPGWLEALLRAGAARPEAAGVGGPIEGPGAHGGAGSGADWAVYFSRYSAYMPPVCAGEANEIPGDNALYRIEALERAWTERAEGFWETLVHRRLRAEGASVVMEPEARVRLGPTSGSLAFARTRFRHGRHFGATRRGVGPGSRLVRAAAAPVLPLFLLGRIARRVLGRRRDLVAPLVQSLPWLLFYLGAWSAGEAVGYLRGR